MFPLFLHGFFFSFRSNIYSNKEDAQRELDSLLLPRALKTIFHMHFVMHLRVARARESESARANSRGESQRRKSRAMAKANR